MFLDSEFPALLTGLQRASHTFFGEEQGRKRFNLLTYMSCDCQDALEIAPSVVVHSVIWACLLHPGSTNSSGVVGVISASLEAICRRRHQYELAQAAAAAEREGETEWERPPQRQLLAGGGSLAAAGLQMSLEQNRGQHSFNNNFLSSL